MIYFVLKQLFTYKLVGLLQVLKAVVLPVVSGIFQIQLVHF